MSEPEQFEKTPRKASLWFRAFIVFALLYGVTFSFDALFNWIFFFGAAYSLFMSYFLLPVQPKIFQARPRQQRAQQFNTGGRASQTETTSAPMDQAVKVRKALIIGVVAILFGMFMIPFVIALVDASDSDSTTVNLDEQSESTETGDPVAVSYVDLGNYYFNQQQYDSAEAYYEKALAIDGNDGAAIYGKGIVAYNRDKIDEANQFFLKSYETGYRYYWLSWALADMSEKQGQTVRAIEYYKESIGLDSINTDSYNRLAELEPANREKYLELARKHPNN